MFGFIYCCITVFFCCAWIIERNWRYGSELEATRHQRALETVTEQLIAAQQLATDTEFSFVEMRKQRDSARDSLDELAAKWAKQVGDWNDVRRNVLKAMGEK